MNRRSLLLTILSLTAAGITGAQAQSASQNYFFQNGNMGSFSGNTPTGWTSQTANTVTSQSANNSPFVNAYADNGSSLSLIRAGAPNGAYQSFSTTVNYTNLTVNFDFQVTTTNAGNNPWGIQFDGGGGVPGAPSAASAVHYRVDKDGYFSMTTGATSGGATTNIMKLDPGAWYNVQANFQVTAINDGSANGAGFQSGTITRQSGFSSTEPLSASWNNVATLNTTAGYSRLLVYDRSPSALSGSLLLDNVAIVPEPSEYALMALGLGLTTLVILRRRKEGQAS
jgi:hypothetical protein